MALNMLVVALFAALALPVSSFRAPVSTASRTSAVSALNAVEDKAQALPFAKRPVNLNGELAGDVGFDPFKFSDTRDLARLREAELKHGRVCMLAATGILFQEIARLGDAFPSKNALEALKTAPPAGLLQILLVLGAIEVQNAGYVGRVPGDRGFDPLGLSKNGINEKWALMELKHGRLAMWATAGMLIQLTVSDKPIIEQTLDWARSFS